MRGVVSGQKGGVGEIMLPVFEMLHMFATCRNHSFEARHYTTAVMKNRIQKKIQHLQTKPIISRVTGQEQLSVVKENRGPSSFSCHWALSRDPRHFQPVTYFCSSTVLT